MAEPSGDFRLSASYQRASEFLFGRLDFERQPKMPYSQRDLNLSRMRRLLDLLGQPHQNVPILHIAGTKGKGSTSAFLTSALNSLGLTCGSYTSPHLHTVEERFCINGQPCRPEQFAQLVEIVRPAVETMDAEGHWEQGPTFFEITTAVGFLLFAQENVDWAIVEVGLGGRLDSTNVCQPAAAVITSISYDHTKQLGSTLAAIATEKAGIIKPGVPVISGVTTPEAQHVIRTVAADRGAPLHELGTHFRYSHFQPAPDQSPSGRPRIDLELAELDQWRTVARGVPLGLRGEHQAANASVAWATLTTLGDQLPRFTEETWQGSFVHAECPARIEVLQEQPLTVVDAAHNVASAEALAKVLGGWSPAGDRWLMIATTRGKDVRGILETLLPHFEHVVCTRYQENPRGTDAEELTRLASELAHAIAAPCAGRVIHKSTPLEAWQTMRGAESPAWLCITGSFFIAAEMRQHIQHR